MIYGVGTNILTFWMISGVIPTCSLISMGSPPAPCNSKNRHTWEQVQQKVWWAFMICNLSMEIKKQSLTAAVGWEAGAAWGATNPAWGLSVARAVRQKQTHKKTKQVCLTTKPQHKKKQTQITSNPPSLAAVTSLVSRAMTLQAASCW